MISRSFAMLAVTACLALTGCAHVPPPPGNIPGTASSPQTLSLQGQLSIKLLPFGPHEGKGSNMGFFFNGDAQQGRLDLMTPLGSQVAQVRWAAAGASIVTTEGEQRYGDLADLSRQVLGEALPLSALMHWLQGRPSPDLPAPTQTGADTFTQSGWVIDTQELSRGRLNATRPATLSERGVIVRVRLDR